MRIRAGKDPLVIVVVNSCRDYEELDGRRDPAIPCWLAVLCHNGEPLKGASLLRVDKGRSWHWGRHQYHSTKEYQQNREGSRCEWYIKTFAMFH